MAIAGQSAGTGEGVTRFVLAASILALCSMVQADGVVTMPVAIDDVLALERPAASVQLAYGEEPSQFGRLWRPLQPGAGAQQLVVLIHGGCWLAEYSINHIHALAAALADAGYAVWALEYRRVGEPGGGWPGTFADIARGLDYVRELPLVKLDESAIMVVGHSAGGHLALWSAAREGFSPDHPLYSEQPLPLRGAIGLAAITDLETYARGDSDCERATPLLMGGGPDEQRERYHLASPALLPQPRPVVLLQGSEDTIVPMQQARALPGAKLRVIDGAGHFDLIHPGTSAFSALLAELRAMAGS